LGVGPGSAERKEPRDSEQDEFTHDAFRCSLTWSAINVCRSVFIERISERPRFKKRRRELTGCRRFGKISTDG
jgi:hypothetical protein